MNLKRQKYFLEIQKNRGAVRLAGFTSKKMRTDSTLIATISKLTSHVSLESFGIHNVLIGEKYGIYTNLI